LSGPVNAIRFLDDGERVLVGSQDELHLLDRDGKVLKTCKVPIRQVTSLVVSRDGKIVWVGGGDPGFDGQVVGVGVESLEIGKTFDLHADVISSLANSPDGKRIVAGSIDQEVGVLDLESGLSSKLSGHSKAVTGVAWIDEGTVVSVAEDMSVRVWDANERKLVRTMNQHVGAVLGVRVLEGVESVRPVVATWGKDRTVRFWQPTIGRMMRFAVLEGVPLSVCWIADAGELIAGDSNGAVSWIDWQTGKILRSEKVSDEWIVALDFEKRSGQVFVGTSSGELLRLANSVAKEP
jgi:WD40 repeat protein